MGVCHCKGVGDHAINSWRLIIELEEPVLSPVSSGFVDCDHAEVGHKRVNINIEQAFIAIDFLSITFIANMHWTMSHIVNLFDSTWSPFRRSIGPPRSVPLCSPWISNLE